MAQESSGAARWTVRLGVAAIVLFASGPLLAYLGIVPARAGFLFLPLGGLCGIVATVLAIVAVARGGGAAALAGGIPGAVVAAWFIVLLTGAAKYPPINDITTNVAEPPQFVAAASLPANEGRDMSYPGAGFAEQQRAGYPDLAGLPLPLPPDDAYQRVVKAAQATEGWQIIRIDPAARALEGVDTTSLFHFKDDFVIEVRSKDGASIVEMRSKSRDGRGDIGANAKRITTFFAQLTQ